MRDVLIATILLSVLVQQRGVAQTADTNSTTGSQPLQGGVQYGDQQNGVDPGLEVTNAAISVRKDATDGIGAPQIGLDPSYPAAIEHWKEVAAKYPQQAASYGTCVQDYLQASEDIKQVSPLTKPPAWNVSGAQINAAIQKASQLVAEGDDCQKVAQATPLKGYASVQQQISPLEGAANSYSVPVAVPAPGSAQVTHVRYAATPATNPIRYTYDRRQVTQEICIREPYVGDTPPTGPQTVALPATGLFFVQAVVNLNPDTVQVQQLVGTDGKVYPVPGGMLTLSFTNQPCGPWKPKSRRRRQ